MFLGLSARSVRVGTLRLQSEFRQPEIENLCLNLSPRAWRTSHLNDRVSHRDRDSPDGMHVMLSR